MPVKTRQKKQQPKYAEENSSEGRSTSHDQFEESQTELKQSRSLSNKGPTKKQQKNLKDPKISKEEELRDIIMQEEKQQAKLSKEKKIFEKNKDEAKQKIQAELKQDNKELELIQKVPIKKMIVKGKTAVDEYVDSSELYHVLEDQGILYDCLLNQTNVVGSNNNNKCYIVQVLETDSNPKKYFVYNRWGRVGFKGKCVMMGPWQKEECIEQYEEKIEKKSSFKGGYKIIEKDYELGLDQENLQSQIDDDFTTSKMDIRLKSFVQLIFDMKMMNQQMHEIGYDPSKMPLGKLAQSNFQHGYKILQEISVVINKKPFNKVKLEQLASDFYTYIPHNFGFSKAPLIKTMEEIKDKLEMLASLEQIQVATKLLEIKEKGNMIDNNFLKLNSKMEIVESHSKEYYILQEYLHNTHGSTHNYQLKILEVIKVQKDLDDQRFMSKLGNRMLLWHGSRLTNYAGILSQGLRIAPPEAPVTGYMFGKGVYFADMVTKSANYCGASKQNPIGCILLCDVALGEINDKYEADFHANELPEGKHSTRGCGKNAPHINKYIQFEDMSVPISKGEPTNVEKTSLIYNEYIVYDVAQIRLKYILKLQFDYN